MDLCLIKKIVVGQLIPRPLMAMLWAQVVVDGSTKASDGYAVGTIVVDLVVPKPLMAMLWAQVVVGLVAPKPQMAMLWTQVVVEEQ